MMTKMKYYCLHLLAHAMCTRCRAIRLLPVPRKAEVVAVVAAEDVHATSVENSVTRRGLLGIRFEQGEIP
jgi:hypothetical protein